MESVARRHPRPRNWKRTLFKVGVFLLLGAIVNVAVAWGCSLSMKLPIANTIASGVLRWPDRERDWTIRVIEVVGTTVVSSNSKPEAVVNASPEAPSEVLLRDIPRWSHIHSMGGYRSSDYIRWLEQANGWPCAAMYGRQEATDRFVSREVRSLAVDADRTIPLAPLWPGFAINTIFYAVLLRLLWLVLGIVPKIRRYMIMRRRIREHRCPACGHIIAAGTCANGLCSECGSPLPKGFKPKFESSVHA